jgi:hypothetical protein
VTNQYHTSQGVKASTTGNISGVYDMAGGSFESVMGAAYNSGETTINIADSGFNQTTIDSVDMSKYLDKYPYGTTSNDQNAYNRRILGDATGETRGFSDSNDMVKSNSSSWFLRGGVYANGGIFDFISDFGGGYWDTSFRVTILGSNS